MTFLAQFEISTVYPLLLFLFDSNLPPEEWEKVSLVLESYLLRRAVCGFSTKNYNRTFLQSIKPLRAEGANANRLASILLNATGTSGEWPSDEAFANAWLNGNAYSGLNNARLVYIYRKLNQTYLNSKHERINTPSLSVEHLMPQGWQSKWPLSDGSTGLTSEEFLEVEENDGRAVLTERRNKMVQTMGNLTILTQPLNSSLSNGNWETKKAALLEGSLLPINAQLQHHSTWDESTILSRGQELLSKALILWPKIKIE
jgi:hypothetical protein